ncbi:hypothetical protein P3X46_019482 [Hevea brasiliensis]|uniref:Uncharacterized protein n=1 Tax=Hevea brasiliensis TaxID=3981 RepID=A0ABQ9LKU5_HEVBR|nr:hypothetical protein P3X46_019482 [Hevea brasiliensis]
MGTPALSEGGEPLTPQSQPSVQFNAPVASQETAAVDGLENAPRSLHESAVLSSQDSHPSFEAESDSLGRRRLQLRDGNGSTIARMITNTFKQRIDTEGVNWKAISKETKEFYWEEFNKKCCWESFEEAGIKNFRKRPLYIFEETWAKFEQHWNDPKVIQWSEIYSRNRRDAANAHEPSTHTSGSITYAEWSDKLDAIAARREELTQTILDNIDENQFYLDVVRGGEKRRKVVFVSYNYQNAVLQQQVQELEKQLEDERQAMTERMDQMKLEMETNMERMRSSMMEEIMRLVRDLPTSLLPPPQN